MKRHWLGITGLIMLWLILSASPPTQAQENRGERIAELESEIEAAAGAERAALLNELGRLILRSEPDRAIELTAQALELAEPTNDLLQMANAQKTRGRAYLFSNRYEQALPSLEEAAQLFTELGNQIDAAKCLGYTSITLAELGRTWPAIDSTRAALEIFRQLDAPSDVAAATNNLATFLWSVGEYEEALEHALESITLQRELENPLGTANSLNTAGNIQSDVGNQEQARDYYVQALELYTEIDHEYGVINCLNNLGTVSRALEQYDEALAYYRRSLESARAHGLRPLEAGPLTNMGNLLAKLGEYRRAMESHLQAIEIITELDDQVGLAQGLANLSDTYLRWGRPAEALEMLDQAHEIATDSSTGIGPNAVLLNSIYLNRAEAYQQLGNYQRAYDDLIEHNEVRTSLLNDQRSRAVAEMQARFDVARRREEVELLRRDNELLTKEQEIRRLQLGRTRLLAVVLALVVVLASTLAVLLIRRYRSLLAFWKKRVFIGPYRVEHEISEGGMGIVYQARSVIDPGQTVALKVIRKELAADRVHRRRFLNEGRIIDALDHPGIVKVHERGEHNQRLYIAMELLEGESLGELIRVSSSSCRPLAFDDCAAVMRQLADAIAAVHSRGVVHRDIKPGNILVSQDSEKGMTAKLLDFGLARLDTMTTLTQAGELLGTVSYLAPERVRHQEPTPASDIFSLGVVFYEMLTLEKPFIAEEPAALIRQLLEADPIDPLSFRPDLDPDLRSLVLSMLHKEPAARPDNEELIHKLSRLAFAGAA